MGLFQTPEELRFSREIRRLDRELAEAQRRLAAYDREHLDRIVLPMLAATHSNPKEAPTMGGMTATAGSRIIAVEMTAMQWNRIRALLDSTGLPTQGDIDLTDLFARRIEAAMNDSVPGSRLPNPEQDTVLPQRDAPPPEPVLAEVFTYAVATPSGPVRVEGTSVKVTEAGFTKALGRDAYDQSDPNVGSLAVFKAQYENGSQGRLVAAFPRGQWDMVVREDAAPAEKEANPPLTKRDVLGDMMPWSTWWGVVDALKTLADGDDTNRWRFAAEAIEAELTPRVTAPFANFAEAAKSASAKAETYGEL